MALLVSGILFVFLMAVITLYGYYHFVRPGRVYEQLGGGSAVTAPRSPQPGEVGPFYAIGRAIQWMGEKVPVSPQDASLTRRFLMAAGFRSDGALATYYGIKLLSTVVFVVPAILFGHYVTADPVLSKVLIGAAALVGFLLPGFVLEALVDRRRRKLRLALPDALDLMVVCVEAGLGLDQAIRRVSEELAWTHPELTEEFRLVNLELRAGKSRAEALQNLAERTGEKEMRKLAAVLIQTDRFGTSMADALRTHSEFMRVRRRQEAEERAGKVAVKLIFPIFFFILPAIIVVAAGPGILKLVKELGPLLRSPTM